MNLEHLQQTMGLDRKSAIHVLRGQGASPDQDLDVGLSTLIASWQVLRTIGCSPEDSLAIANWFGDEIRQHARELYAVSDDPSFTPLMIQLLDNRWVATSGGECVYDLQTLSEVHPPIPRAMLGVGVCVDEVYRKYVAPSFEPAEIEA